MRTFFGAVTSGGFWTPGTSPQLECHCARTGRAGTSSGLSSFLSDVETGNMLNPEPDAE